MIKFKFVDKRTNVGKRIAALMEQLEELPKEFLRLTADEIVARSPVDTGTYMEAHNIGATTAPTTSTGKPRHQEYGTYADAALGRLYAQIEALPTDTTRHYISNNSQHAWKVEYEHGWAPYTSAREKAQIILDDAIRKVMNR